MSTATISAAVFGVGPSGLAAAQAILNRGGRVTLFSNRTEPSQLYGCQYLHAPIPGHEDVPTATVGYELIGSTEEYRRKVYGHSSSVERVSPEDFAGTHPAWDIRETYKRMWDYVIDNPFVDSELIKAEVTPQWIGDSTYALKNEFEIIISTIPASHLCHSLHGHKFSSRVVYAAGDSSPGGPDDSYIPNNTVVCDGTDEHNWYRFARVFDYGTMEWAQRPHRNAAMVEKPIDNDCNCFPWIIRAGRYGVWAKGILVHQVYQQIDYLMQLRTGIHNDFRVNPNPNVCPDCARWGLPYESMMNCVRGHSWGGRVADFFNTTI